MISLYDLIIAQQFGESNDTMHPNPAKSCCFVLQLFAVAGMIKEKECDRLC